MRVLLPLIIIVNLTFVLPANGQTISTFAGNGTAGYTGDNGPATLAWLSAPTGVVVDKNHNVYITDADNYVIRMVNGKTGTITKSAGTGTFGYTGDGGPALQAQFNHPTGIAVDTGLNLYVADYDNNVVRKINAVGIITTIAGNGAAGYSGDGLLATAASLSYPSGVAVDNLGNVYIVDHGNNRIRRVDASTGIITTVAGNGTSGYGGDGGAAVNSQLAQPYGLCIDGKNNIYVADYANNRVRKIDAVTSIISTIAGNGMPGYNGDGVAAISASISSPLGVGVDALGNIYIPDLNQRIRIVDAPSGIITTIAGNGNIGYSGDGGPALQATLHNPWSVSVDVNGDFYIADIANFVVRKVAGCAAPFINITPSATTVCSGTPVNFTVTSVTGGVSPTYQWQVNGLNMGAGGSAYTYNGFTNGDVVDCIVTVNNVCATGVKDTSAPITLTVNPKPSAILKNIGGNCLGDDTLVVSSPSSLYQISWYNGSNLADSVLAKDTTVIGTTVAGANAGDSSSNFNGIWGSFVDAKGNLYVSDSYKARILKFPSGSANGVIVAGGNGLGSAANQLYEPEGVYVDASGNIFVADWANNRVQKWAPGATEGVTVAGGNGEGSAANELYWPSGVYGDAAGNIYVADYVNARIQKWAPGATTGVTVAGFGYGTGASQLGDPTDVFVDASGNIYISDWYNNRVQEWAPGATEGITVAGGNGAGSAANQLSKPYSVFVDGSGDVYVSDWGNNRIQKWLPGATAGITVAGGNGQGAAANQLYGPYSLYVNGNGDIYIADGGNNRVQKWAQQFVIDSVLVPSSAGTYHAVVSTIAGCTDTTNSIAVNPSAVPSINIVASATNICGGTTVNFSAVPANGGAAPIYQWQVNGVTQGTNSPLYSSSTLTDSAVVTCTVTSNAYCAVPDTAVSNQIIISVSGQPFITITADTNSICVGTPITFSAAVQHAGASPALQWLLNGNATGAAGAMYTDGSLANGDLVSCVVAGNSTCAAIATDTSNTITVQVLSTVTASVTVNASPVSVCAGVPVIFTATPVNGGNAPNYQWQVNGVNTATGSNTFTSAALHNGDSVTCIITSSLACAVPQSASGMVGVVVYPLPMVNFNPDTVYATGNAGVRLNPVTTGSIIQYQWRPTTDLSNATAPNPAANPAKSASYQLLVTTNKGCTATADVTVFASLPLDMPGAFTPNGDGHNDVFRIPPGVNMVLDELDVFDRWGSKVFTSKNISQGWDGTYNGVPTPPGAYVYMIKGKTATGEPVFLKGTVVLIR